MQRIKSTIEKKVQKELSTIDLEIEKTKKVINDLILEKKQRKEEVKSKKSLKVSELNFYESLEKNINAKIELVEREIKKLEKKRIMKQLELVEKSKETKMFEKLEVKHYSDFVKEQNKIEQIEMDDIATKKFVRSGRK